MRRRPASSVTQCPRCGAGSQVEDTAKSDSNYVRRLRGCIACGNTWSTAEIMLTDVKKLKALNKLLKELRV